MKQVNVKMSPQNDLDFGEVLNPVTSSKAYELLMNGKDVSAKFHLVETYTKKGCRKCNKPRRGTFCSECGAKISDKALEFERIVGTKWITVGTYLTDVDDNGRETRKMYMDECHPYNPGRTYNKCTLSLEYFASIKIWYWRGF